MGGILKVHRYLDRLYFTDSGAVYVCEAASCVPQQLVKDETNIRSFTVGPGYAFWLASVDAGTAVRRLSLSSSTVATIPSPGNFASIHLTAGPAPELVTMGSHLYRSPPAAADLTSSLDIIDFYYQPTEIALTSVGNRILYNHPTASVASPGPHVCAEGAFCQNAQPVVAVKAPLSSLGVDGNELYYANDSSLYRTTIGATGTDGGVPLVGQPLASFDAAIAFADPRGKELVVVTKDTQSNGRVLFAPKGAAPTTTFEPCPRPLRTPASAAADADELFVAEERGIVAYHR